MTTPQVRNRSFAIWFVGTVVAAGALAFILPGIFAATIALLVMVLEAIRYERSELVR